MWVNFRCKFLAEVGQFYPRINKSLSTSGAGHPRPHESSSRNKAMCPGAWSKDEPDTSEIPRQVTPEGNVLRVRGHALSAHAIR